MQDPDERSALGPSTEDLWDEFSGTHTLHCERESYLNSQWMPKRSVDVTVAISPSDFDLPGASACWALVAAVTVDLDSESGLEDSLVGALIWDKSARVEFDSQTSRGEESPQISGILSFGYQTTLRMWVEKDGDKALLEHNCVEERSR